MLSSKRPVQPGPSKKASRSCAMAAATSSLVITRMSVRARSTRISTSTASISRSAGAGAASHRHFLRALLLLERHAERVPWREIGGRTYALDQLNDALADAEAMRIPKALVAPQSRAAAIISRNALHENHRDRRAGEPLARGPAAAPDRRRRRLPPELFPRHTRIARRDLSVRFERLRRIAAGISPSCRT